MAVGTAQKLAKALASAKPGAVRPSTVDDVAVHFRTSSSDNAFQR
ncbi:hypothetical protein [Allokutzneria oryzae]|uniref:FXSXX-COOH protein n=1 Tax=Allokutzneria oryzae TaxID=1378989 RepID=A0ABV6A3D8_9PSEU